MTGVRTRIIGGAAFRRKIDSVPDEVAREVAKAVGEGAALVRGHIIRNMGRGNHNGRVYTHFLWTDPSGNLRLGRPRWKPHRASAPGDFPARDSGDLEASLFIDPPRGLSVKVGTNLKYGAYLQFGTRRMAARPWLDVALREVRPRISKLIVAAIRKGNAKGAR